jgi:2',3'-cyclic-nucleotide 2'-phosphodiesterase (5'-nucleotidase family)
MLTLLLFALLPPQPVPAPTETVTVTVLATTDTHGFLYPWD